jgi:hypothetical protein
LGFPDTTQDADIFVDRSPANCRALVAALKQFDYALTAEQSGEIDKRNCREAKLGFETAGRHPIERSCGDWSTRGFRPKTPKLSDWSACLLWLVVGVGVFFGWCLLWWVGVLWWVVVVL